MPPLDFAEAASRLCRDCGLCCNGVLFHLVRLQPGDSVRQLESLGLKLNRKKREPYFAQPCRLLHERSCSQYAARPVRCRLFECRQLRLLADGSCAETEARACVRDALRRVARVEELLARLGNTDAHLPLAERCAQTLALEFPGALAALAADLKAEMKALDEVLNESFRLKPLAPPVTTAAHNV